MTTRRGPRGVGERLRRLLVMLPWLMERGEASLAEMAERFQISENELVRDLEQAAMCGLPPFLDEVVDLFIDDDGIAHAGVPRFFTKPLRLTAPEAFTLLAAGRVAMSLPGADPNGPLGRALVKLQAVLGEDAMVLDLDQPPATADLIEAATHAGRVAITYWAASSDETTERLITPRAVFADRGRWYVLADDDRSGEERIFRIDRISEWTVTGEVDRPRLVEVPTGDAWFNDAPDLPVVRLRVKPAGQWLIERFPVRSVTHEGDDIVAEMVVASDRWLEHVLLRLGPNVEVISPKKWKDRAARSARALLDSRYAAAT
jgi:proteasome accessory factor C